MSLEQKKFCGPGCMIFWDLPIMSWLKIQLKIKDILTLKTFLNNELYFCPEKKLPKKSFEKFHVWDTPQSVRKTKKNSSKNFVQVLSYSPLLKFEYFPGEG